MNKIAKHMLASFFWVLPGIAIAGGHSVNVPDAFVIRGQVENTCSESDELVNLKTTLFTKILRDRHGKLKLKVTGLHETGDGYSGKISRKKIQIDNHKRHKSKHKKSHHDHDSNSHSSSSNDDDVNFIIKNIIKNKVNRGKLEIKSMVTASIVDDGNGGKTITYTQDVKKVKCKRDERRPNLSGTDVTIVGPERGFDGDILQTVLDDFANEYGLTIHYVGTDNFSQVVDDAIALGAQPTIDDNGVPRVVDILLLPQPQLLDQLVDTGAAVPVSSTTKAAVHANWRDDWVNLALKDNAVYGTPNKSDLKSLIYYRPAEFTAHGYEVPNTWEELLALTDTMIADKANDPSLPAPFCVGIESGGATGWNFTDWVEDLLLGSEDLSVYDAWVANDIGFTDPKITQVWEEVLGLWHKPGAVFNTDFEGKVGRGIVSTNFIDAGFLFDSGLCFMHRQASFLTAFGLPNADQWSAFAFPGKEGREKPILGAGTIAISLSAAREVDAVLRYFSTPDYANNRQTVQGGGFLSAVININKSLFAPLDQIFLDVLASGELRFDASDLMPESIGASFVGDFLSDEPFDFTTSFLGMFNGYGYFGSVNPGNDVLVKFGISSGFWAQGTAAVLGLDNMGVPLPYGIDLGPAVPPLFVFDNFMPGPGFEGPESCPAIPDPLDLLCPAPDPLFVGVLEFEGTSVCEATQILQIEFCNVVPTGAACDDLPLPPCP